MSVRRISASRRGEPAILKSVLTLPILLGLGSATSAGTIYWDASGTGWDAASSWSINSAATTPDPAAPPGSVDVATFNISTVNTNQTVNLNADQSAAGLVFGSIGSVSLLGGGTNRTLSLGTGGLSVSSGAGAVSIGSSTAGQNVAISLAGAQTWTNNGSGAVTISNGVTHANAGSQVLTLDGSNTGLNTISGVIGNGSGTMSIVKNGTGRWILGGTNTFTGGITVNAGTLGISAGPNAGPAPSPAATQITFVGSSTLQFQASIASGSAININRTYAISNGVTATVDTQGFTDWAGNRWTASGNGKLAKIGSGNLVFNGSGDNSGLGIVASDGNLYLGKTSTSAHAVGGNGLLINGANAVVYLGVAQLTGTTDTTTAADQIYDDATFGATVTVNAGTFDLYGRSERITALAGNSGTIRNNLASTTSTLTIGSDGGSQNSSYSGAINNGNGTLSVVKAGNGTLTLSGTNLFTGGLSVTSGTLAFGADANLGGAGNVVSLAGGTIALSGSVAAMSHTIATGTTGGAFALGSGKSLQINNFNANTATITGSGNLALSSGQLVLSGNNTGYSGNWSINGGLLEVQYNGSTSIGTGSISIASGAEVALDWAGTISNAITSNGGTMSFAVLNGGTYSGPVALNSGTTTVGLRDFYSTSTARNGTISGVISGTGALATSGSGILTLSAINNYSGGTQVSGGTVAVASGGTLGTGNVIVTAGTLQLDNNNAIADSASLTLNVGTVLNLNFLAGTNELVQSLTINGTTFSTPTVFNSSNGYNGYASYFTGTGGLQIIPEPAGIAAVTTGLFLNRLRRHRRPSRSIQ